MNEEEYYKDLENRIANQRTSREMELDMLMYIENQDRPFKKTYFDSFYGGIEKRHNRNFNDPIDYMNCILEYTIERYKK